MNITKLKLKDFRNYKNENFEFSKNLNFIIGNNGVGKTNILEAITILSSIKSFRNISDRYIIKWNEEIYFCSCEVDNCKENSFSIGYGVVNNKKFKRFKLNNNSIKSITDYYGKLLTVIFSPNDIDLINGSPEIRRKYFDSVISKIDKDYLLNISKYKKILLARNKIVKNIKLGITRNIDELESWDILLADKASKIIFRRIEFIELFNKYFYNSYENIGEDGLLIPNLRYISNIDKKFCKSEEIYKLLLKERSTDIRYGTTRNGPHKDDFKLINSEDKLFYDYASQGQKRTASISIKVAECEIIEKEKDEKVIILVDDIFSELDNDRKRRMVEFLQRGNQVIFTMVDNSFISDEIKDAKIIRL